MKKKEIKIKVRALLSSGAGKSDVFARLAGQGVKDRHLAHLIASHAEPELCEKHETLNNAAITLMFIQSLFAFLIGYGIGAKMGPNAKLIFALFLAAIPLLFAWGFYKHLAGAYNTYLFLTLIQLPKGLEDFSTAPIGTSIGFAINIGILVLIWYLRSKLFPDFLFMSPKKVKGKYVFSS